jgi:hypothetical protein
VQLLDAATRKSQILRISVALARWFARGRISTHLLAAFRPLFRLDLPSPPGIPSEANQRVLNGIHSRTVDERQSDFSIVHEATDADPDIPILKQAKAEYAKLQ